MKSTKKKPLLQCEALHEFLTKAGKPVEFTAIVDMLNANKATEIKRTQASASQYIMAAHRVLGRAMRQYSMTMATHEHPESKVKRLYSAGNPPQFVDPRIARIRNLIQSMLKTGYAIYATDEGDELVFYRDALHAYKMQIRDKKYDL